MQVLIGINLMQEMDFNSQWHILVVSYTHLMHKLAVILCKYNFEFCS